MAELRGYRRQILSLALEQLEHFRLELRVLDGRFAGVERVLEGVVREELVDKPQRLLVALVGHFRLSDQ